MLREKSTQETKTMILDRLSTEFSIPDQLSFFEGNGGFPFIMIDSEYASAVISIYGGQVLSFKVHSIDQKDNDLLFVSDKAYYQHGKAIKGGIPVCWPWFGKDPEGLGRPSHGFARNLMWSVKETSTTSDGETLVSLGLIDTEDTREVWPHAFNLTLTVTVGKTLKLELLTRNTGNEDFTITQALHTYFNVGDINQASITGLDGIDYIDTTITDWPIVKQKGDITFEQEVDRIYTNVPIEVSLIDNQLKHQTLISSIGSNSTVIWNPWAKIATEMADLQNDDYRNFLCIETTNAASDTIEIKPNKSFCLTAKYKTNLI